MNSLDKIPFKEVRLREYVAFSYAMPFSLNCLGVIDVYRI